LFQPGRKDLYEQRSQSLFDVDPQGYCAQPYPDVGQKWCRTPFTRKDMINILQWDPRKPWRRGGQGDPCHPCEEIEED